MPRCATVTASNSIGRWRWTRARPADYALQVRSQFLIATDLDNPVILEDDPFHQDRWDYVYYLTIGREDATFKRWVTIVFENDRVIEIRRDQELAPDL